MEGYLLNLCREAGFDKDAMRQLLEDHCDYEGVTHDLVTKVKRDSTSISSGISRHEADFPEPDAPRRLPDLFDDYAITTNFDRVPEKAYEKSGKGFIEKITGRGPVNAFYRAIPAGERYLRHGDKCKWTGFLRPSQK